MTTDTVNDTTTHPRVVVLRFKDTGEPLLGDLVDLLEGVSALLGLFGSSLIETAPTSARSYSGPRTFIGITDAERVGADQVVVSINKQSPLEIVIAASGATAALVPVIRAWLNVARDAKNLYVETRSDLADLREKNEMYDLRHNARILIVNELARRAGKERTAPSETTDRLVEYASRTLEELEEVDTE